VNSYWLFWICVAVDAYTDFPRVAAFLEPYAPDGGWWQLPFFFIARMVLYQIRVITYTTHHVSNGHQ
jgi:hypothetical protein